MFRIHIIDGYIASIFMAVYPDRVLLLDSGCHCDTARIETVMKRQLKRPMSQIKLAVASHTHPDHAGGAHILKKRHNLPIAAPKEINRWYAGASGSVQHAIDTMLGHYVAWTQGYPIERLWYNKRLSFDHPLHDGDTLPGFEDWRVITTPGHTGHDMVLYHEESETLYAADVVLKVGRGYRLPFPVSMRLEMKKSLARLRDLKVSHLLMAHGGYQKIDSMEPVVDALLIEVEKGYPPEMARLKKLEYFSPVLKEYYREIKTSSNL